ncbi:hypothetical protein [Burkholderia pseudomallei]|uniref:hypothetical protein n=2 Tax=Burkholderia pseudomallei TaxID=28450 RepID=UPI00117855B4|nr:hypothetical protein [Burkholderia pseudomallei]
MASSSEQDVMDVLGDHQQLVKSIRIADGTIFLSMDAQRVASSAHEQNQTSRRQLAYLAKVLEARFNMDVHIALSSDEANERIEALLRDTLTRAFPGEVSEVTVGYVEADQGVVWIDAGNVKSVERANAIRGAAQAVLTALALPRSAIHVQAPVAQEPTVVAILVQAKILSPATLNDVYTALAQNFWMPSEDWLSTKLDTLRKKGYLLRDRDGRFHVTELGLLTVPHGRRASSTDVVRALRLSRRK